MCPPCSEFTNTQLSCYSNVYPCCYFQPRRECARFIYYVHCQYTCRLQLRNTAFNLGIMCPSDLLTKTIVRVFFHPPQMLVDEQGRRCRLIDPTEATNENRPPYHFTTNFFSPTYLVLCNHEPWKHNNVAKMIKDSKRLVLYHARGPYFTALVKGWPYL